MLGHSWVIGLLPIFSTVLPSSAQDTNMNGTYPHANERTTSLGIVSGLISPNTMK
jgi:hypothetical protein